MNFDGTPGADSDEESNHRTWSSALSSRRDDSGQRRASTRSVSFATFDDDNYSMYARHKASSSVQEKPGPAEDRRLSGFSINMNSRLASIASSPINPRLAGRQGSRSAPSSVSYSVGDTAGLVPAVTSRLTASPTLSRGGSSSQSPRLSSLGPSIPAGHVLGSSGSHSGTCNPLTHAMTLVPVNMDNFAVTPGLADFAARRALRGSQLTDQRRTSPRLTDLHGSDIASNASVASAEGDRAQSPAVNPSEAPQPPAEAPQPRGGSGKIRQAGGGSRASAHGSGLTKKSIELKLSTAGAAFEGGDDGARDDVHGLMDLMSPVVTSPVGDEGATPRL
jgi:hypothetical protein